MNRLLLGLTVIIALSLATITAQDKPDNQPTTPLSTSEIINQLTHPEFSFLNEPENSKIIRSYQILDNGFLIESLTLQIWNGTDWDNFQRLINSYSTQNLLIETVGQLWNGSDWINSARAVYTYTGAGVTSTITYQDWNGSDWVNSSRTSFTYNGNDLLTERLSENWTGSTWENNNRELFTYLGDNNLDTQTYQIWNGASWANTWKDTYQWNANNMPSETLKQTWNGASWVNYTKSTFSYDANDNPLDEVIYLWNGAGWDNFVQYLKTYDGSGNLTELLNQDWDPIDGWVNDWHQMYQYDGMNNRTEELGQTWDPINNQWINQSLSTSTYNSQNLVETTLFQLWNPGTGWENDEFITFTYDANNNLIMQTLQQWNGTDWENAMRMIYNWIPVTGIDDEELAVNSYKLFNNYPNPFNPSTIIKFHIELSGSVTLTVFDVLGNDVAELVNRNLDTGNYEVQFTPEGLSSGVYFYKLEVKASDGKKNFTGVKKMILMK